MSEQLKTPEKIAVNQAFDPEERQAQAELDAYMDGRPFQDVNGAVHNPEDGKIVNSDEHFDKNRVAAEAEGQVEYEDMPMSELARKLGQAEFYGDKTSYTNIEDALLDKQIDHEKRTKSKKDKKHNNDRVDNLQKKLDVIKNKEIERLQKENGVEPDDETTNGNTEPTVDLHDEANAINDTFDRIKYDEMRDQANYINGAVDRVRARANGDQAKDPQEGDTAEQVKPSVDVEDNTPEVQQKYAEKMVNSIRDEASAMNEAWDQMGAVEMVDQDDGTQMLDGPAHVQAKMGMFKRLKNKMRELYSRAGAAVTVGNVSAREKLNDEEKRTRNKWIGAGIGAVALAAGSYLIYKTGQDHSHIVDAVPDTGNAQEAGNQINGHEATQGFHGEDVGQEHIKGDGHEVEAGMDATSAHEAAHFNNMATLAEGDTIWDKQAEYMAQKTGVYPSNAEIQSATQRVLDQAGISWQDARSLPVGYEFKLF